MPCRQYRSLSVVAAKARHDPQYRMRRMSLVTSDQPVRRCRSPVGCQPDLAMTESIVVSLGKSPIFYASI